MNCIVLSATLVTPERDERLALGPVATTALRFPVRLPQDL
jgi:hypothetical protein